MKKHYHVLEGLLGGYMPDSNDVYTTLREAKQGMSLRVDWAKDAQAQGQDYELDRRKWILRMDEHPWQGSIKSGWYENGVECISITTCYEKDCQEKEATE